METSTALVPITKDIAEKFFNTQNIDVCLTAIEKDALNFIGDSTTARGRKDIITKAASISSAKVIIDNVGKKLNDERKRLTDIVNADRKKARDFLDNLKLKVRKPVTEWENEEEAKKQAERDAIEYEMDWDAAHGEDDLFNRQKEIERKEAELENQEAERIAKEKAEQAKKERIEREARIAKEAKEQAEREAEERIEAEKQAKIDAENRAKEAAKRAELEKIAAKAEAEREKQEAIEQAKRDEQDRIAEEKRKTDIKAKNHAHQKKINREALNSFVAEGFKEPQSKDIITLIAKGNIKHISINY